MYLSDGGFMFTPYNENSRESIWRKAITVVLKHKTETNHYLTGTQHVDAERFLIDGDAPSNYPVFVPQVVTAKCHIEALQLIRKFSIAKQHVVLSVLISQRAPVSD